MRWWNPLDVGYWVVWRIRWRFHRKGCCSNCGGTGVDASSPETNGRCWDCYGTGHTHL